MKEFEVGDRVQIITGARINRTGTVVKLCSVPFEDHLRVDLDLKPRQRVQDTNELIKKIILINLTQMAKAKTKEIEGAKAHGHASLQMVPTSLIMPDPNQPRKFFDETAQAELIESVKSNGILQPLLLRPNTGDLQGTYLLVCGERRYRAALSSDVQEVPAVIRTLTNAEALELQIVENLQRKDVHPMEEAVAFKSLRDKFSVEELGLRVGKSAKYVTQRIKLNDLNGLWQELLFENKITLTHAFLLCRLSTANQDEVWNYLCSYGSVPKDWKKKKEWDLLSNYNLTNVLNRQGNNLSGAPFKTTDATLYPEMGACTNCPFNSATQPLLFEDLGKKRICSNSICYQKKCKLSYKKNIDAALQNSDVLFIAGTSYPDEKEKSQLAAAGEVGALLLDEKLYHSQYKEPEHPGSWEDWLKEKQEDCWDEDTDEEEKKSDIESWKDDYDEEVKDYEDEIAEWNDAKEKGLFRKAFIVAGRDSGKYVDIQLKNSAAESSGGADSFTNADIEIAKMKEREKRNKELDAEKVYGEVTKVFDHGNFLFVADRKYDLTKEELTAVVVCLWETGNMSFRDWMKREYKWDQYHLYPKSLASIENITVSDLNKMLLHFIGGKLLGPATSHLTSGLGAALFNLTKSYLPDEVNTIELAQMERADKRQANVNKRISALQKQKSSTPA